MQIRNKQYKVHTWNKAFFNSCMFFQLTFNITLFWNSVQFHFIMTVQSLQLLGQTYCVRAMCSNTRVQVYLPRNHFLWEINFIKIVVMTLTLTVHHVFLPSSTRLSSLC